MECREGMVLPSVLTDDPEVLKDKVRRLEPLAPEIQVDIMDGVFVPALSVTAEDVCGLRMRSVLEVHLMVTDPSSYVEGFLRCGAKRIVFHIEPVSDPDGLVRRLREARISPGIALNPETPVGVLKHVLGQVDVVLIMGVNPGRQGQQFMLEVLEKVGIIKRLRPEVLVELDGGMNPETGRKARLAGVDILNAGSYLFQGGDVEGNWHRMQEVARNVLPTSCLQDSSLNPLPGGEREF